MECYIKFETLILNNERFTLTVTTEQCRRKKESSADFTGDGLTRIVKERVYGPRQYRGDVRDSRLQS